MKFSSDYIYDNYYYYYGDDFSYVCVFTFIIDVRFVLSLSWYSVFFGDDDLYLSIKKKKKIKIKIKNNFFLIENMI